MPPRGRPPKVKPQPILSMEISLSSLNLEDTPLSSDTESGAESECVKCGEKVDQLKKDIPPLCEDCLPIDIGKGEGSTSEEDAQEEEEEGGEDDVASELEEAVEVVSTFVPAKAVCPTPIPDLPPVEQQGRYTNIIYMFLYVYYYMCIFALIYNRSYIN